MFKAGVKKQFGLDVEITFDGEHHVERELQVRKLYWLNRQEAFLLPPHHVNQE